MAKAKTKVKWQAFMMLAVLLGGLVTVAALFARPSFKLSGAWDCDRYNIDVSQQGLVSVINGSSVAEPATGVEVYIDGVLAATLAAPALAPGQQATIGGVPVPANGVFRWRAIAQADRNCDDSGSYGIETPPNPPEPPVACKLEVDFEKRSDGTKPNDNQLIRTAFTGLTFSMKNPAASIAVPAGGCAVNLGPRIAAVGAPRTAFQGYNGVDDTVEPWSRSGSFILTDDGKLNPTNVYKYACTIRFDIASQYHGRIVTLDILDIDDEGYVVRGYNTSGKWVSTIGVPPTIKGNGIAYKVSLVASGSEKIAAVEVIPNRFTKGNGWGWGIDNICVKD